MTSLTEQTEIVEATPSPVGNLGESKKLRLIELLLVLFVAFAAFEINSIYVLLTEPRTHTADALAFRNLAAITTQVAGLGVLAYVLFRQGRTLGGIGFSFSWKDVPVSILLAIAALIAGMFFLLVWRLGASVLNGQPPDATSRNVDFLHYGISPLLILFVLINPFFEELIARAFTISEVEFLTGSNTLAVAASVAFQCSYHLYQGVVPTLSYAPMFLVFSLYYVKRQRIMPVILAHLYFDLMAVIAYTI